MSQLTHPHPRVHRVSLRSFAWLVAVILAAGIALALVISDDDPAPTSPVQVSQQVRPDESAVAAAVAGRPIPVRPDESSVAAAISVPESTPPLERPNEGAFVSGLKGH